jgi:hypothetical protein
MIIGEMAEFVYVKATTVRNESGEMLCGWESEREANDMKFLVTRDAVF